ncbi:MAG: glutamate--tRNA ligase [Candidatus Pacebacteria bacterium]|nr:glutamate--tRNA ligase [Candidatus Paceibacterota bacterium]
MKEVVVRIPPSPTGNLHIGTARTALFNFLFAKQNNGKVILRMEDTDKERSTKEFEEDIKIGLEWLSITHDEFYRQSERDEIYKKHLQDLINSGNAYISKETEGDRDEVIRFKNPNKEIKFNDLARGEISFDTTELGNFVIAKSIEEPLYHLAVVVDDFLMGITHVIRGEDGISNTPRQILIQEALGAPRPIYVHLPLILGPDRSKLSKRHGAKGVMEYKKEGYLPEAFLNFLAFLGWNPGGENEIFTLDELTESFDIEKIQKGGAIYNEEKLRWFNREHLKKMTLEEKKEYIKPILPQLDEVHERALPIIFERIETFGDLAEAFKEGEFSYLNDEIEYDARLLLWKKDPDVSTTSKRLENVKEILEKETWPMNAVVARESVWKYAEEEGKGEILWPLRVALSGKERSPDPFVLIEILGKDISMKRIGDALTKLKGND